MVICECGSSLKKITSLHLKSKKHYEYELKKKQKEREKERKEEDDYNKNRKLPFSETLYDVKQWTSGCYDPVVQRISRSYYHDGYISLSNVKIIDKIWESIPEEYRHKYAIIRNNIIF